jgi:hypothetical protein
LEVVVSEAKERPILFSGSLVRAILEGRKTQTRRPVKQQHIQVDGTGHPFTMRWDAEEGINWRRDVPSPYGTPGDRLWVRETWRPEVAHSHGMDACDCGDVFVTYAADGKGRIFEDGVMPNDWVLPEAARRKKNVPSIHMPRWASRINLEVTEVRVERLQAITEEDARAEGVEQEFRTVIPMDGKPVGCAKPYSMPVSHRAGFANVWGRVYGAELGWEANPWVWVVGFKKLEAA